MILYEGEEYSYMLNKSTERQFLENLDRNIHLILAIELHLVSEIQTLGAAILNVIYLCTILR